MLAIPNRKYVYRVSNGQTDHSKAAVQKKIIEKPQRQGGLSWFQSQSKGKSKYKYALQPAGSAGSKQLRFITEVILRRMFQAHTGFSSEIGTKLRDWAVGQAGGQLLLSGSIVLK